MGNNDSRKNNVISEEEIQFLIQKTGLSRLEILDFHDKFLVRQLDIKIISKFKFSFFKDKCSKRFNE